VDLQAVVFREQTILGNRVYTPPDIDRALALLADDGESFRSLISDIVPLTEAAAAFDRLRSGQGVKVVVTLEAA
jgi:threonine dehydrogenase-like Zn-dependent dehydrogenase